VVQTVGLSSSEIIAIVALAEAIGEMQVPKVPPPQMTTILDKLRKDLTEKP